MNEITARGYLLSPAVESSNKNGIRRARRSMESDVRQLAETLMIISTSLTRTAYIWTAYLEGGALFVRWSFNSFIILIHKICYKL